MAGTELLQPITGFMPFDNSALRARLADQVVRTRSIEAELRAAMHEREQAAASAQKSRWR
jgi:hypothetical protein